MWQENKSKGKLKHSSEEQALLVKHKFVQKAGLISIISISQAMLSDTCYKERIFFFSVYSTVKNEAKKIMPVIGIFDKALMSNCLPQQGPRGFLIISEN